MFSQKLGSFLRAVKSLGFVVMGNKMKIFITWTVNDNNAITITYGSSGGKNSAISLCNFSSFWRSASSGCSSSCRFRSLISNCKKNMIKFHNTILTLSQTTDFRLAQIERNCRRQFQT